MAVHAHPDDEATGTGGVLARYSDEGIRTVLVTCTDGACGDGPGGVKPGDPGHDPAAVVAMRRRELSRSCEILGIRDVELLGYPDSGMMGWPQNDAPGSFWSTPVEVAAARLARLMEQYRPQVVVTYDANGFYGHPDHIQAHRITMAAVESTGIPAKVYFTTMARSRRERFSELIAASLAEAGEAEDDWRPDPDFGTPDADVDAWIDVMAQVERKQQALAAHASQTDSTFFLQLSAATFAEVMGEEVFVRAVDRIGAPRPEDDLFAGLR